MSNPRVHRLLIAYHGASLQGWQRQGQLPTVQLELERVVEKIWGEPLTVHGSGRTDSGVHAFGQVASFTAVTKLPDPIRLRRAFNDHLPGCIRVLDNDLAPDEFHARFSSIGKEYVYRIIHQEVMPPHLAGRAWHVPRPLDQAAMQEALKHVVGRHDFSSFASNPGYERTTMVRNMTGARMISGEGELFLTFHADGFLYRMVRNLAGALVKVGLGRISADDFQGILLAKRRQSAPNTAPAEGLYLMRVLYPPHLTPAFHSFATGKIPWH